jgi:FAD:protein FMN transferase
VKRREFVSAVGAGLAGLVVPHWAAAQRVERFVERWSWAMGQSVHLMVFAASEQEGLDACAAALAELRRVETHLTLFDDASDLCELNRRAGKRAMRVDADLGAVVAAAERFRRATGGAFNAAVEPLMRTWGFHRPRTTAPSPREIVEARAAVTTAVVEQTGDIVRLPNAHTQFDFGSIGVGYGIDRVLAVLKARGIARAFIDVSGDCAALGPPPGETGWPVGIAAPSQPGGPGRTIAQTRLRDAALATAANTVSLVRYRGLVAGHVMNPATGWPAHSLRQASVVTRTATAADALSTALFVSGRRPAEVLWAYTVKREPPSPRTGPEVGETYPSGT